MVQRTDIIACRGCRATSADKGKSWKPQGERPASEVRNIDWVDTDKCPFCKEGGKKAKERADLRLPPPRRETEWTEEIAEGWAGLR